MGIIGGCLGIRGGCLGIPEVKRGESRSKEASPSLSSLSPPGDEFTCHSSSPGSSRGALLTSHSSCGGAGSWSGKSPGCCSRPGPPHARLRPNAGRGPRAVGRGPRAVGPESPVVGRGPPAVGRESRPRPRPWPPPLLPPGARDRCLGPWDGRPCDGWAGAEDGSAEGADVCAGDWLIAGGGTFFCTTTISTARGFRPSTSSLA